MQMLRFTLHLRPDEHARYFAFAEGKGVSGSEWAGRMLEHVTFNMDELIRLCPEQSMTGRRFRATRGSADRAGKSFGYALTPSAHEWLASNAGKLGWEWRRAARIILNAACDENWPLEATPAHPVMADPNYTPVATNGGRVARALVEVPARLASCFDVEPSVIAAIARGYALILTQAKPERVREIVLATGRGAFGIGRDEADEPPPRAEMTAIPYNDEGEGTTLAGLARLPDVRLVLSIVSTAGLIAAMRTIRGNGS